MGNAFGDLASPSQAAIGGELLARIEAAFAELSEDEREVVLLSRVAGLPRREVAQALGRSENAVRNLLHDQVTHPDSHDVEQRWARLVADEATFRKGALDTACELAPAIG